VVGNLLALLLVTGCEIRVDDEYGYDDGYRRVDESALVEPSRNRSYM